ncbi:hypothetical protein ABL57_14300 [Kocuria sp. SM24M-10]|nr:hypothetical protein ABL57_14300 [Kocuria sp. SM24M-10]
MRQELFRPPATNDNTPGGIVQVPRGVCSWTLRWRSQARATGSATTTAPQCQRGGTAGGSGRPFAPCRTGRERRFGPIEQRRDELAVFALWTTPVCSAVVAVPGAGPRVGSPGDLFEP